MLDKLKKLALRFEQLSNQIADPLVIADQQKYQKLTKELSRLDPIHKAYLELESLQKALQDNMGLLSSEKDKSMLSFIEDDITNIQDQIEHKTEQAQLLLIPEDSRDSGGAIVEIRAGAGGDEAGLFVGDLARMYRKYAEKNSLSFSLLDSSPGLGDGFKEIVFEVTGEGAFSKFKFEGGTHRVQRVPDTEAQGRIHTSTVTVAVLPEKSDVKDIEIRPQDLKIDTFRSQGAGGQHVNTTDSAVRITHLPSGVVVACQEERSQIKNRAKAMNYLKAKLYDAEITKMNQAESSLRKEMVGTGDRSEKIRTYNYPQGRISDHRIKLTIYKLDDVMQTGSIDEIVEKLHMADQLKKLQEISKQL